MSYMWLVCCALKVVLGEPLHPFTWSTGAQTLQVCIHFISNMWKCSCNLPKCLSNTSWPKVIIFIMQALYLFFFFIQSDGDVYIKEHFEANRNTVSLTLSVLPGANLISISSISQSLRGLSYIGPFTSSRQESVACQVPACQHLWWRHHGYRFHWRHFSTGTVNKGS